MFLFPALYVALKASLATRAASVTVCRGKVVGKTGMPSKSISIVPSIYRILLKKVLMSDVLPDVFGLKTTA